MFTIFSLVFSTFLYVIAPPGTSCDAAVEAVYKEVKPGVRALIDDGTITVKCLKSASPNNNRSV